MNQNNHRITSTKTDRDNTLGYEKNSLFKSFANLFLIPALNNIPPKFRNAIKKSHEAADEVIKNATTHQALEVLYQNGHPHKSKNLFQKVSHHIWFHSNNSRGVRNRLRLVKRELKEVFLELVVKKEEISILSIASGSARAVIESLKDAGAVGTVPVLAVFLDKNPEALRYSQAMVKEFFGNDQKFRWLNDTVGNFFKTVSPKEEYNVVEMVGLLDYFDDEKTIETLRSIHESLKPNGSLITANIVHNKEMKFVTNAIGWPMIYRRAEELAELLHKAGFQKEKMLVLYEPLKVHTVIVAEK